MEQGGTRGADYVCTHINDVENQVKLKQKAIMFLTNIFKC